MGIIADSMSEETIELKNSLFSCQHLANILENNHEEFKGNIPEELAKRLKDNNISLCDKCEEITVFRWILENVINGNEIIEKVLDSYVTVPDIPISSVKYNVSVLFHGLYDEENYRQTAILEDLLTLNNDADGQDSKQAINEIILHPVMVTFITLKWKRFLKFYLAKMALFFVFLIVFTVYIYWLFKRPSSGDPHANLEKISVHHSFRIFSTVFGVLLFLHLIVHLLWEVFLYKKPRHRNSPHDFMMFLTEGAVFITAIVSVATCDIILKDTTTSAFLRGLCAIGICLAWIQLIFLFGRYPILGSFKRFNLDGGDFSVMFTSIVQTLFRYIMAMFSMVSGFACAFMILEYKNKLEEEDDFKEKDGFEAPFEGFVKALAMTLGEFTIDLLYKSFLGHKTSRSFSLVILMLLMFVGHICMVNLFIAAIMSDVDKMKSKIKKKNLINMADYSILAEERLPKWLLRCTRFDTRIEGQITVCVHSLCIPKKCNADKSLDFSLRKSLENIEMNRRHAKELN